MTSTPKSAGLYSGRLLQVLTAMITFGVIMTIGMIIVPVIFGNLPRPLAIVTVTAVMAKASSVLLAMLLAFSFGSLLRVFCVPERQLTKSFLIKLVLSLAFIAFSLYNLLLIVPSIAGIIAAGKSLETTFHNLHSLSMQLFAIEGGLAILLTVLLI